MIIYFCTPINAFLKLSLYVTVIDEFVLYLSVIFGWIIFFYIWGGMPAILDLFVKFVKFDWLFCEDKVHYTGFNEKLKFTIFAVIGIIIYYLLGDKLLY